MGKTSLKKEVASITLDRNDEIFVIYLAFLASLDPSVKVYFCCEAQIDFLKADKAPISVFLKNADFPNIFSKYLITKFLEYSGIKNHFIDLAKGQRFSYKPIYSL